MLSYNNQISLAQQYAQNNAALAAQAASVVNSSVNYSDTSISGIKKNMLAVLPTYKECLTQWLGDPIIYTELENFLKSDAANDAILYTYNKYGIIPINPGSPGKYPNCSGYVANVYNYSLSIKYYLKYANYSLVDANNCQRIKEQLDALEIEKLNADKQLVADQNRYRHSSITMILGDIQSNLLAAYSNMSCATRTNDIKQTQTLAAITQAADQSTEATTGSTQNNIIYIIAAIVIIAIVVKLFNR